MNDSNLKTTGMSLISKVKEGALEAISGAILVVLYLLLKRPDCGSIDSRLTTGLFVLSAILGLLLIVSTKLRLSGGSVRKIRNILLIVISAAVILFGIHKYQIQHSTKFHLLVARFKKDDSDPREIRENILDALQKLSSRDTSASALDKNFSRAEPADSLSNCLNDCGGTALIWGYYSNESIGSLKINVEYADKCLNTAGPDSFRSFRIQNSDSRYETKIEESVDQIVKTIEILVPLLATNPSCNIETLSPDDLQRIKVSYEAGLTAAKANGEIPQIYTQLARLLSVHYFRSKDTKSSREILNKALILFPKNIDLAQDAAEVEYRTGNYDRALTIINTAISYHPDDASLLNDRGILNRVTSKPAESIIDYTKAIELARIDPNSKTKLSAFLANRASMYEYVGNIKAAHTDYKEATNIEPKNQRYKAFLIRSEYALTNGANPESKLNQLAKILNNDPCNSVALETKIIILNNIGKNTEATEFEKIRQSCLQEKNH